MADHSIMTVALRRLLILAALVPAACNGQAATTSSPPQPAVSGAAADAAGIVWLCLPGKADNPCTGDLSTTVIDPSGTRTVVTPEVAVDPPIDCFYVYPTTSAQTTINASLTVDAEEIRTAKAQAALFSQVCKVYAPIYPQLTQYGINSGRISFANVQQAYDGVKAAFDDYLANYNRGRGIVFIGHSQGSMLLVSLLADEIDSKPENRKLLVSALLMGAQATTAPGKTTGGDFADIPTCTSASQTGCVVGFSTFEAKPPKDAAFGRISNMGMLRQARPGQQIMCVNPAAPGGKGALQPIFLTEELAHFPGPPDPLPTTAHVSYPGQFTAECAGDGEGNWLQVTRTGSGSLPVIAGAEGPGWGLHDHDVSLTLGNLIELVRLQAAAFGR